MLNGKIYDIIYRERIWVLFRRAVFLRTVFAVFRFLKKQFVLFILFCRSAGFMNDKKRIPRHSAAAEKTPKNRNRSVFYEEIEGF